MHAADCGAKQIFFNLFDKSKAKLEKVRKVQASPPLGRKNTRAGPFCTWQPTLGTGLLLGLAFLKGYLYLGFQPARAYCMHKDGSSIFRKKKVVRTSYFWAWPTWQINHEEGKSRFYNISE